MNLYLNFTFNKRWISLSKEDRIINHIYSPKIKEKKKNDGNAQFSIIISEDDFPNTAIKADITIIDVYGEEKNIASRATLKEDRCLSSVEIVKGFEALQSTCPEQIHHFECSLKHNRQILHEPSEMNFADYDQQNLISYRLSFRNLFQIFKAPKYYPIVYT